MDWSVQQYIDLTGLILAVSFGGVLAGLGVGIDSLLLTRHAKSIDDLALRWWLFFDNLRFTDIPRVVIGAYIQGKNKLLGAKLSPMFFLRTFILSLILTILTVPGGRALGIFLLQHCNESTGLGAGYITILQSVSAGWGWTGTNALTYLVPINIRRRGAQS